MYTCVTYSNKLEGALYIPSHNVLICSYSDNNQLYSELHGLAKSNLDQSPSVPHMVISKADASAAMEYHRNGTMINYITQNMFTTTDLQDVSMPQDGTIKVSWNVAHLVWPQFKCLDEDNKSNASTHVSPEVLANCQVYSWQHVHSANVLVIFVGNFGMEDNDIIDCHKLLVAPMQSMITKILVITMLNQCTPTLPFLQDASCMR